MGHVLTIDRQALVSTLALPKGIHMANDDQTIPELDAVLEEIDMQSSEVFHYKDDCPSFEDLGNDNGFRYWYASDLAKCLGYETFKGFKNALNKALAACGTLSIPVDENFVQEKREVDGVEILDYRLSRFACYLTAMNGDSKKEGVAQAQVYFAVMSESFRQYVHDANEFERLNIRDEITGREKALGATAKNAGVTQYAYFQNAGYRGLYNMNLKDLKKIKKLPIASRSLLDFMGKQELAANLFRITQTEAHIQNNAVKGQKACEITAESVGKMVRKAMMDTSGTRPEALPLESDIKKTRSSIKSSSKEFKKIDGPKKGKD